jgi:hypothetical protein
MIGPEIDMKGWKFLVDSEFDETVQSKMSQMIVTVMSSPIILDLKPLLDEKEKGIAVRTLAATGTTRNEAEENWDEARMMEALTLEDMKKGILKGKCRHQYSER